jgi:hypothetical protein
MAMNKLAVAMIFGLCCASEPAFAQATRPVLKATQKHSASYLAKVQGRKLKGLFPNTRLPDQYPHLNSTGQQYLQFSSAAVVPRMITAAPLDSMLQGLRESEERAQLHADSRRAQDVLRSIRPERTGIIIIPPPKNGYGAPVLPSRVGDLSYNETTGIINTPAAKVMPAGGIQLGVEWQDMAFPGTGFYTSHATGPEPLDGGNALFDNAGDTHGIWGIGHNIELSVENLHAGINSPIFGGKWLAVDDDADHPAFAIGVQSIDLKAQNGITSQYSYSHPAFFDHPSVFGVVGHTFVLNDNDMTLELDGGIGTGRLRNGFAGAELHFNKWLALATDNDGNIESTALKFYPSDRFEIWLDMQSQVPYRYGASIRYTLGATKPRGAPAWAQERDTTHVPEPDLKLFSPTNHLE